MTASANCASSQSQRVLETAIRRVTATARIVSPTRRRCGRVRGSGKAPCSSKGAPFSQNRTDHGVASGEKAVAPRPSWHPPRGYEGGGLPLPQCGQDGRHRRKDADAHPETADPTRLERGADCTKRCGPAAGCGRRQERAHAIHLSSPVPSETRG